MCFNLVRINRCRNQNKESLLIMDSSKESRFYQNIHRLDGFNRNHQSVKCQKLEDDSGTLIPDNNEDSNNNRLTKWCTSTVHYIRWHTNLPTCKSKQFKKQHKSKHHKDILPAPRTVVHNWQCSSNNKVRKPMRTMLLL